MGATRIPQRAAWHGRMLETAVPGRDEPDELLVKGYLTALNSGRFLDALNAFSMDASLRDESGRERHGIREIAAAFARRERPFRVEIEDIRHEGDVVSVRVRMSSPQDRTPRIYRSVFHVRRDRIHALEINPLPASRSKKRRVARTA
jgi:hypothetical protein